MFLQVCTHRWCVLKGKYLQVKRFDLQILRSRSFLRILLTIPPNPTASGINLLAFDLETCIFSSCMKELRRFGGREASQAVRGGTGSHSQQLTCPGISGIWRDYNPHSLVLAAPWKRWCVQPLGSVCVVSIDFCRSSQAKVRFVKERLWWWWWWLTGDKDIKGHPHL